MKAELDLKHAKAEWQSKVKETDVKMGLREQIVLKRQDEIYALKDETLSLQKQLAKADQKLEDQQKSHVVIQEEIDDLKKQRSTIDQ